MTKNPFKPADGGETNEAKTATTGATAKRPRKQDMSPEEWRRHVRQVRIEAAARAVEAHKAKARGRKPMTTVSVRMEDAEKLRRLAADKDIPVSELLAQMLSDTSN